MRELNGWWYSLGLACIAVAVASCSQPVAPDPKAAEVAQVKDPSSVGDSYQHILPTVRGNAYVISVDGAWYVDGEQLLPVICEGVTAKRPTDYVEWAIRGSQAMADGSLIVMDSKEQLWRLVRQKAAKITLPGWPEAIPDSYFHVGHYVHPMLDGSAIVIRDGLLWRLRGSSGRRITLDGEAGKAQDFKNSYLMLEVLRELREANLARDENE